MNEMTTNLVSNDSHLTKYDNFLKKFKMAFYAPELRLMLGTVAAKFNFGWSSVIVSAPPTRLSQNRGRCLLTAQ